MEIIKIPKKSGGYRTIYIPDMKEKWLLWTMVDDIALKAAAACPPGVCHGFTKHRNAVTNATAHIGHRHTICMDLTDFFDNVTPNKVTGLTPLQKAHVFVDGAARQGLPTSPAVANLAAAKLDHAIVNHFNGMQMVVTYTRYADDLALSFHDSAIGRHILEWLPQLIEYYGWQVNEKKTRWMKARHGRRIITGVGVGDTSVHPTRRTKRKLRAALDQGNMKQAVGLAQWAQCPLPRVAAILGRIV
tara:strand:+ start:3581 stop:4315 length:735 start_codon:yes stop_codon:yes gene_type:complete